MFGLELLQGTEYLIGSELLQGTEYLIGLEPKQVVKAMTLYNINYMNTFNMYEVLFAEIDKYIINCVLTYVVS